MLALLRAVFLVAVWFAGRMAGGSQALRHVGTIGFVLSKSVERKGPLLFGHWNFHRSSLLVVVPPDFARTLTGRCPVECVRRTPG